jgi:rubrerythrin
VHAHSHLAAANGINSTADNLKEAIAGETHEFTSMYPDMIRQAETEGNAKALRSFTFANEVEKIHAALYQKALNEMETKNDVTYYVCGVCGYTCENEAPEVCPVCKSKKMAFSKVD